MAIYLTPPAMLFTTYSRKGILYSLILISGIIVIPRHFLLRENNLLLLPAHIEIPVDTLSPRQTVVKPHQRQNTPLPPVELNSADSSTLVKIRGIGPYYATKIIRYRQRLGGFHSIGQLKEVNMTYFNVDSCAHMFKVNPELIIRRDLDTMSFKSVLRHPYLEYEDVQLIFNAKRKYGQLSYETLEKNGILAPHKLKKIKPYFK